MAQFFQKLPGVNTLSSLDLTDGFEEKRLFFRRQLEGVVLAFRSKDRHLGTVCQRLTFDDDLSIDNCTRDDLHGAIVA